MRLCCSLLYRVGLIFAQLLCVLWDRLPAERQAPVKVAAVISAVSGHGLVKLKRVQVNWADLWTDHSSGLLHNTSQQRLQPAVEALTWKRGVSEMIMSEYSLFKVTEWLQESKLNSLFILVVISGHVLNHCIWTSLRLVLYKSMRDNATVLEMCEV